MLEGLGEKVSGFLFRPTESFRKARGDTLESAAGYYVVFLVIYAALAALVISLAGFGFSALFGQISGFFGGILAIAAFVGIIVAGLIGVFIGGAWLHLWVLLLGGAKGYAQTVKALMYGGTPSYIFGWIPVLGFAGAIWSLVLTVIGLHELQEIPTERSIAALVLAFLVPFVVIVVLGLAFFTIWSRTITPM
jgi:hypothetical protein